MSKRKVKMPPQCTPSNSRGKKVRDNVKLKIQQNEANNELQQIQLLKDAGVDDETMKTIPDSEKQAIIKAILESNQLLRHDDMEPTVSGESGRNSSASHILIENDEDTQPPDASDMCISPLRPDTDSHEETKHGRIQHGDDDEMPPSKKLELEGGLQDCDNSPGNLITLTSSSSEKDVISLLEEDTQPYQLKESSSVLATETQFSPRHMATADDIDLDTIPESPSPTSPNPDKQDTEEEEELGEAEIICLQRIYPMRSTTTHQGFTSRCSRGSIKDPTCYSQVIKLMFDIYFRRLRSAQSGLKGNPLQWGKPVRTGVHCEHLLRRKVVELERTGKKDDRTDRGRRHVRKKLQNENSCIDTVPSAKSCEKSQVNERRPKSRNNASKDVLNEPTSPNVIDDLDSKNTYDPEATDCIDFDEKFLDKHLKRKLHTETKMENYVSISESKRKRKNDIVNIVEHCPEGEHDHSSHPSGSNMPVKRKVDKEITFQESDVIEGLEDDVREDAAGSKVSLLSTKKGKGKKNADTIVRKQSDTDINHRPDSPHVEKCSISILKSKDRNKVAGQSSKSRIFIPEEDLCIIDEGSDSSSLPDITYQVEGKKLCGEKSKPIKGDHRKETAWVGTSNVKVVFPLTGAVLAEDIPSSMESGSFLDAHGDMYCTQIGHKSRKTVPRKVECTDNATNGTQCPSSSSLVVITSDTGRMDGKRDRKTKKKTGDIDEVIEISGHNDMQFETIEEEVPKKRKRSKNRSLDIQEKESFTVLKSSENDNDSDIEDKKMLKESRKVGKSVSKTSLNEKYITENKGQSRKKKRKLFDEDLYVFKETELKQSRSNSNNMQGRRGNFGEDKGGESDGTNTEERKDLSRETNLQPSSKDDDLEEIVDQGECPICENIFMLTELEAHASTCGEGTQVNREDEVVKCMICHKEINRGVLKEHQTQCANTGAREEPPTRRITRGKKSDRRKRSALVKEKSPSSSGEDYEELVVELAKEKK